MKLSIVLLSAVLTSIVIVSGCKAGDRPSLSVKTSKEATANKEQADKSLQKSDLTHKVLPANHPFALCATCHGVDAEGNQDLFSPRLSGQNVAYIDQQTESFKKGWRGSDPKNPHGLIMAEIAKNISDEDLVKINKYLQSISSDKKSPRLYANSFRGARLYKNTGCSYCHGDNAEGDPVNKVPRLNHQHGWYLLKQLKNFKNGVRGAHKEDAMGHTMAFYAKTIHDEQSMHDIISWITSLSKKN